MLGDSKAVLVKVSTIFLNHPCDYKPVQCFTLFSTKEALVKELLSEDKHRKLNH